MTTTAVDLYLEKLIEKCKHPQSEWQDASVEQIVTGPTTSPDTLWVVILYRHDEVEDGTQLIAYARLLTEDEFSTLTPDQLNWEVTDTYGTALNEPPGDSLPDEYLRAGDIAWRPVNPGWNARTGPPGLGLPATRIVQISQSNA